VTRRGQHYCPTRRSSDLPDEPVVGHPLNLFQAFCVSSLIAKRQPGFNGIKSTRPSKGARRSRIPLSPLPGTSDVQPSPLSSIWRSEEHTSELQSRENLVC